MLLTYANRAPLQNMERNTASEAGTHFFEAACGLQAVCPVFKKGLRGEGHRSSQPNFTPGAMALIYTEECSSFTSRKRFGCASCGYILFFFSLVLL